MARPLKAPPILPVALDERRVLFRLGYRKPSAKIGPTVRALVGEETERAGNLIRPGIAAALLERAELPPHPVFRDARKAALCICTIGGELEEEAARMVARGDLLRGLVLDWLGSEAVTGVSRQAGAWLVRECRAEGLWPSKMFAPGDKGWDVSGQELIFASVPASAVGVRLSASFMMTPRKSFSFRISFFGERRPSPPKGL